MQALNARHSALLVVGLVVVAALSASQAITKGRSFARDLLPRVQSANALQYEINQACLAMAQWPHTTSESLASAVQHIGSGLWFAQHASSAVGVPGSAVETEPAAATVAAPELMSKLSQLQSLAASAEVISNDDFDAAALDLLFEDAFIQAQRLGGSLQAEFAAQARALTMWLVVCLISLLFAAVGVALLAMRLRRRTERQGAELEQAKTELIELNGALRLLAVTDGLTRLPNRKGFLDDLEQAITRAQRHEQTQALLYLAFDDFKHVNAVHGHAGGDELLRCAAERLRQQLAPGEVIARMGGDDFAVLLAPETCAAKAGLTARTVAEKLAGVLRKPFTLTEGEARISASIGIALAPEDSERAEDLIRFAMDAVAHGKTNGKGRHTQFTRQMESKAQRELFIESELRSALAANALEVYYQPQRSLRGNRNVALEALVRWRHPTEGFIPPGEFIAAAERVGLIDEVAHCVFMEVFRRMQGWTSAGIAPDRICLNLAPSQFARTTLCDELVAAANRFGIYYGQIELEVTESMLSDHSDKALPMLRKLADAGFRIAIDDFGTGASALAGLHRFPAHALKIDRSFIQEIHTGDAADAVIEIMLNIAQRFGLAVVAEGVESVYQERFLAERGCDYVQGFLYGRPLAPGDAETLLRHQQEGRRAGEGGNQPAVPGAPVLRRG